MERPNYALLAHDQHFVFQLEPSVLIPSLDDAIQYWMGEYDESKAEVEKWEAEYRDHYYVDYMGVEMKNTTALHHRNHAIKKADVAYDEYQRCAFLKKLLLEHSDELAQVLAINVSFPDVLNNNTEGDEDNDTEAGPIENSIDEAVSQILGM